MAFKISKADYDKYSKKLEDMISKRNNTHDPMARMAITKKIAPLRRFLDTVEVKL